MDSSQLTPSAGKVADHQVETLAKAIENKLVAPGATMRFQVQNLKEEQWGTVQDDGTVMHKGKSYGSLNKLSQRPEATPQEASTRQRRWRLSCTLSATIWPRHTRETKPSAHPVTQIASSSDSNSAPTVEEKKALGSATAGAQSAVPVATAPASEGEGVDKGARGEENVDDFLQGGSAVSSEGSQGRH